MSKYDDDKAANEKAKANPPAHHGVGTQEHRDPTLGTVNPLVRETETLPVKAHIGKERGDPVGHARHAETPEEVAKIEAMEMREANRRVPPPGSRHYVAGQPVNDEEYQRTEGEANRLADAGLRQRTEAEQRMKENTPGDPDYHPADGSTEEKNAKGKK
jgi:hypothetical protein